MSWLTPADVAARLNVSPRTVQKWCREEAVTHVRIGRVYRFTPDMVDELATAHTVGPRAVVDVSAPNPRYAPRHRVVEMRKR